MKEAIQKAIEGGYIKGGLDPKYHYLTSVFYIKGSDNSNKNGVHGILVGDGDWYDQWFITSDPLFWQALGKAMEWSDYTEEHYTDRRDRTYSRTHPTWILNWHSFIDHLAEGKDAESFFNTIFQ